MAVNYVQFLRGTPTAYNAADKDPNILYFISDPDATTGKLYLGEKLISGNANVSGASALSELSDVNLEGLTANAILVYNATTNEWEAKAQVDNNTTYVLQGVYTAGQGTKLTLNGSDSSSIDITIDHMTAEEIQSYVDNKLATFDHLKRVKVDSVDKIDVNADDALNTIYMVPTGDEEGSNRYNEYMVMLDADGNRHLEQVGTWDVDLSNYVTKTEFTPVQTKVGDLDKIINGYIDPEITEETVGLVTKVGNLEEALKGYVTTSVFEERVSTLENRTTWQEMK